LARWLVAMLTGAHLGLLLLVVLGSGWPRKRRDRAPEIDRNPVEPLARWFVYGFAFTPAVVAIVIAVFSRRLGPLYGVAPRVVLSGLAGIVFSCDRVRLYRERITSSAWLGLLVVPPALTV